jgi:type II secretory pathway pseudopilin PulG
MRRPVPASEQGYIMLIAIFLMALVVISLAIAAPQVAKSIQRDRDLETYHRGMQYRRAIQLYYRAFKAYPPNVDALVETNKVRFLRKKYVDPITNKPDWKPVLFGQNKTPTAMGFFGQPLAGGATSIAGIGPGGGNGGGTLPSPISQLFGGSPTSSTSGAAPTSPTDNSNGTGGGGSTGSTSTSPSGTTSSGSTTSSTSSDQSGQTFGGGGIIGFSPGSPKQSIRIFKKKNHYNEWEFTYDPISDAQTISGGNAAGIGQNSNSNTSGASGNTNSNSNNTNSNGTVANPPSPSPDAPQQQ